MTKKKVQREFDAGLRRGVDKEVQECDAKIHDLQRDATHAHADVLNKKHEVEEASVELSRVRQVLSSTWNALNMAVKNKSIIDVSLSKARHELLAAVQNNPQAVPSLQKEVDEYEAKLQQVMRDIDEKQKAQREDEAAKDKAIASVSAAQKALQVAEKFASGLDGKLRATKEQRARLQSTKGSKDAMLSDMTGAVEKQEKVVDALTVSGKTAHRALEEQQKKVNQLAYEYRHGMECVSSLEQSEANLSKSINAFAFMEKAFVNMDASGAEQDDMFGNTWDARDALEEAKYKLNWYQVDCAPDGRKPRALPKPQSCRAQTEGSCELKRIFGNIIGTGCKKSRGNAYCAEDKGYVCYCPPGWCASKDRQSCRMRGSPVEGVALAIGPEPEVGSASPVLSAALLCFLAASLAMVRRLSRRPAPRLDQPLLG